MTTNHQITLQTITSGCRRTSEMASIGDGEYGVAGLTTFYPNIGQKSGKPYAKVNVEEKMERSQSSLAGSMTKCSPLSKVMVQ